MEIDILKRIIKTAEKQIDRHERPAQKTSLSLLEAARDYLWLLTEEDRAGEDKI